MTAGGGTVVVTGAGRGLGLGLARCFAADGHRVIGTARDPDRAQELATVADRVVALDQADDASIAAAAEQLLEVGPIDVLVNNAGINALAAGAGAGDRGTLALDRQAFLTVMDVNAAGPMLVTRALLPALQAADEPIVVNISSQLGSMAFAAGSGSDIAYNASKAALNMVTVRLAAELAGDGICCVALHPGWVKTDMGGPAAALTVEESASAIVATVGGLELTDSGRFLRWDGSDHPW